MADDAESTQCVAAGTGFAPLAGRRPRWRRWARRWPLRILVLYVLWVGSLALFQERVIFPAWGQRELANLVRQPARAESLWLDIGDGQRVEAWFIPGQGCESAKPGPLVVMSHGNGEVIDFYPDAYGRYSRLGISLLLPEFRGYGRSGGAPGEAAIVGDALAFLEQTARRPEVDPSRIFYHGRSIGGAVVAQLAARRGPRVLILESTFTSLPALAARYLVPGMFVRHRFETDRVLRTLAAPVLIMHGEQDEIVPYSHGRALLKLAREARFYELGGGHNDGPADEREYWDTIECFLRDTGVLRP